MQQLEVAVSAALMTGADRWFERVARESKNFSWDAQSRCATADFGGQYGIPKGTARFFLSGSRWIPEVVAQFSAQVDDSVDLRALEKVTLDALADRADDFFIEIIDAMHKPLIDGLGGVA